MEPITLTDRVEGYLRRAIIEGELAPSTPLRMAKLTKQFGAGATPVREALSRLLPEGLVELSANKGFRVRGVSREDLIDVVVSRTAVEAEALRLSIQNGDDRWEADIVGAQYRLRKQMQANDGFPTWAEVEAAHDDLHRSLLAACGSPRLVAIAEQLMKQHNRYQRLFSLFTRRASPEPIRFDRPSINRLIASPGKAASEVIEGGEDLPMFHDDLIAMVLERDAERAIPTLRSHIAKVVELLDEEGFWTTNASGPKGKKEAA